MGKICAFFGHRNVYGNIDQELEKQVEKLIIQENIDTFWVGGYGEFDRLASRTVRKMQEKYLPMIIFELFLIIMLRKNLIMMIWHICSLKRLYLSLAEGD